MTKLQFAWKCYQAYRGDPKAALEVIGVIRAKVEAFKK
jgi:hypothetical protein